MLELDYTVARQRQAELRCEVTEARLGRPRISHLRMWRQYFRRQMVVAAPLTAQPALVTTEQAMAEAA